MEFSGLMLDSQGATILILEHMVTYRFGGMFQMCTGLAVLIHTDENVSVVLVINQSISVGQDQVELVSSSLFDVFLTLRFVHCYNLITFLLGEGEEEGAMVSSIFTSFVLKSCFEGCVAKAMSYFAGRNSDFATVILSIIRFDFSISQSLISP